MGLALPVLYMWPDASSVYAFSASLLVLNLKLTLAWASAMVLHPLNMPAVCGAVGGRRRSRDPLQGGSADSGEDPRLSYRAEVGLNLSVLTSISCAAATWSASLDSAFACLWGRSTLQGGTRCV